MTKFIITYHTVSDTHRAPPPYSPPLVSSSLLSFAFFPSCFALLVTTSTLFGHFSHLFSLCALLSSVCSVHSECLVTLQLLYLSYPDAYWPNLHIPYLLYVNRYTHIHFLLKFDYEGLLSKMHRHNLLYVCVWRERVPEHAFWIWEGLVLIQTK